MELKIERYVITLLVISVLFFFIVAPVLETETPYTDLLLTIALVHYIMTKLVTIKKAELKSRQNQI